MAAEQRTETSSNAGGITYSTAQIDTLLTSFEAGDIITRSAVQTLLDYYDEAEVLDSNKINYPNMKLFEEKKRTGNWSTDFIRFEWEKVYG